MQNSIRRSLLITLATLFFSPIIAMEMTDDDNNNDDSTQSALQTFSSSDLGFLLIRNTTEHKIKICVQILKQKTCIEAYIHAHKNHYSMIPSHHTLSCCAYWTSSDPRKAYVGRPESDDVLLLECSKDALSGILNVLSLKYNDDGIMIADWKSNTTNVVNPLISKLTSIHESD